MLHREIILFCVRHCYIYATYRGIAVYSHFSALLIHQFLDIGYFFIAHYLFHILDFFGENYLPPLDQRSYIPLTKLDKSDISFLENREGRRVEDHLQGRKEQPCVSFTDQIVLLTRPRNESNMENDQPMER